MQLWSRTPASEAPIWNWLGQASRIGSEVTLGGINPFPFRGQLSGHKVSLFCGARIRLTSCPGSTWGWVLKGLLVVHSLVPCGSLPALCLPVGVREVRLAEEKELQTCGLDGVCLVLCSLETLHILWCYQLMLKTSTEPFSPREATSQSWPFSKSLPLRTAQTSLWAIICKIKCLQRDPKAQTSIIPSENEWRTKERQ